MDDVIEAFKTVLPYIKYFFDEDISVALCNKETFLLNLEGNTIHMNISNGEPIPTGGAAVDVLRSGKPLVKNVPQKVYGVAFRSYAVPIKNRNNEVVGAVLLAKNYEKSKWISSISQDMYQAIEEIATTISDFTRQLDVLQNQNKEIEKSVSTVNDTTKQADSILAMVRKLANKSRILGLNASIEAAKAGEAGRGFNVVAEEIQKMGNLTLRSAEEINKLISGIVESIRLIYQNVQILDNSFSVQTDEIKSILDYIEGLNKKAEELADFAAKL